MYDSFATPWTVTGQGPLSLGLPRQEYWSGFRFPSPGDLPNSGMEPESPALLAVSLPLSHQGSPNLQDEVINILFQLMEEVVRAILTEGVFKATEDSYPIHNEHNWLWFIT